MSNAWSEMLDCLRVECSEEEYRRWFRDTAYASDSGDQITVWVTSEGIRRHLELHFMEELDRARVAIGRPGTAIRFVVAGVDEEEED